jgi:hypothetical protein
LKLGKSKGQKPELQRELAAVTPKPVARAGRKSPVTPTQELALEVISRFESGEMVSAICASDERFPTDRAFRTFIRRDEALAARWETAKQLQAERLAEDAIAIADHDAVGADGRVDPGKVQRDKLRVDVRMTRAAALDPARWGRKTEQTIVGDPNRPVETRATLAPIEVVVGIRALLTANERSMGLITDESSTDQERLARITSSGKPVTPELYEALNPEDDQ